MQELATVKEETEQERVVFFALPIGQVNALLSAVAFAVMFAPTADIERLLQAGTASDPESAAEIKAEAESIRKSTGEWSLALRSMQRQVSKHYEDLQRRLAATRKRKEVISS